MIEIDTGDAVFPMVPEAGIEPARPFGHRILSRMVGIWRAATGCATEGGKRCRRPNSTHAWASGGSESPACAPIARAHHWTKDQY